VSPASEARVQLEEIFREALSSVDAASVVRLAVERRGSVLRVGGRALASSERVVLLAAGKAAWSMAGAFEQRAGDRLATGLVVTKDGHVGPRLRSACREAAHPVPDARCEAAAREALSLVERARPEDVLCVLLSGGASSLLACPAPGLELEHLAATTRALLAAGADIGELNVVRKHLSDVSGGWLARRAAARRIELLVISDVPGDRLDLIGSGPCTADPSRFADALEVLERRGVLTDLPEAVRRHLEAGARGERAETPKPGDPALARVRAHVLACNRDAVEAARDAAVRRGLATRVVSVPLEGEAREAGRRLVELALRARGGEPLCLVAGGETVVTVRGGRGGRNQELALAAALALDGGPQATLLAAGTDGSDGPTDAAGAFADAGTVERGRRAGRDARAALRDNDAHGFFAAEGGLFVTGPTGTNVMDLALLRLEPAPETAHRSG
jgi:glycerate-2-kinase